MGWRRLRHETARHPLTWLRPSQASKSAIDRLRSCKKWPPSTQSASSISSSVGIAFAEAIRIKASRKSSNVKCSSLILPLSTSSFTVRMRDHEKMKEPSRCGKSALGKQGIHQEHTRRD
eukprot:1081190-Prymnesium_polylepis.1